MIVERRDVFEKDGGKGQTQKQKGSGSFPSLAHPLSCLKFKFKVCDVSIEF